MASFHPKVQISDVPDFTFINKIDLPNFRGCLNNWRYHSGGSFAIFEHAPLLLPTANCSPPTFCEFPEVKILTLRKIATRLRKSRSQKGSPGQISHAFSNPTSQRRFSWQIATSPRSPCAQLTLKMTSRSRFLKNPTFRYIAPYNTTKTQNF